MVRNVQEQRIEDRIRAIEPWDPQDLGQHPKLGFWRQEGHHEEEEEEKEKEQQIPETHSHCEFQQVTCAPLLVLYDELTRAAFKWTRLPIIHSTTILIHSNINRAALFHFDTRGFHSPALDTVDISQAGQINQMFFSLTKPKIHGSDQFPSQAQCQLLLDFCAFLSQTLMIGSFLTDRREIIAKG